MNLGKPMKFFFLFVTFCSFNTWALECGQVSDVSLSKKLMGDFVETSQSHEGQLQLRFKKNAVDVTGLLMAKNEHVPKEGVDEFDHNGWANDFFHFDYRDGFTAVTAKKVFEDQNEVIFQHSQGMLWGEIPTNKSKPVYYRMTIVVFNKLTKSAQLEQYQTYRPEFLEVKKLGVPFLRAKAVGFRNKKNIVRFSNCSV